VARLSVRVSAAHDARAAAMPQFREVQGAESPEFLQLFDNGVQCAPLCCPAQCLFCAPP